MLTTEVAKIGRGFSRFESLYMPILKGWDERMTTEIKKRFAWLPNSRIMSQNVDGESVQIAGMRLLRRREAGKALIVLSDGFPAASGGASELYGHLTKVVQDFSKTDMSVVGIGIESDAVQKFYPRNMVLRNVSELPSAVMKELRGLLIK
jgi:cobalamin biosynthesis protein CobT